MPTLPASACSVRTCPRRAVKGGRCAEHQRQEARAFDQQRGTRQERGYGSEWQRIRKAHLEIEPECRHCGATATDVDHIVSKKHGGSNEHDNLQSLCHKHHSVKTRRGE